MIRPPLFGQDSSPQYTAPRLAAMSTSGLTLIFILLVIFVPAPKPKQKYETVRIVLDTTPIEKIELESGEPSAAGAEASAPVVEEISTPEPEPAPAETPAIETPVVPEPIEAPAPVVKEPEITAPVVEKVVESKTAPKEDKPYTKAPEYKIKPDVMDTFNEKQKDKSVAEWKDFDEDDFRTAESDSQKINHSQPSGPSLSGSSGAAAEKTSERQSINSTDPKPQDEDIDENLKGKLGNIADTVYQEKDYSGSNSTVKIKSASVGDGTSISMNDGTSRTLVKPKKPTIQISPESTKDLGVTTTVTIMFTVLENGTVPISNIEISPKGSLFGDLKDDIIFQISTWRFEPGETKATASFEFTIKKN